MKIKRILVSQPEPTSSKSPYADLAEKHNLKIDFRPFIQIEGVDAKDFRKTRVHILDHTAVIFTSRTAVDHFFRICEEIRITVPETMKYFCISEAIALYLQKYIVYRKRKIFFGNGAFPSLVDIMKKHKDEVYFFPVSDMHKPDMPKSLDAQKLKYTLSVLYRTVSSDLSDLKDVNYDMLVFYSPSGIKSLLENFPDFEQKETQIAVFGPATAKAVEDSKLRLDLAAPAPQAPSMTMAIDKFLQD